MTKKKVGHCSICGEFGQLSFEHVPPRSAFNKASVVEYLLDDAIYKTGAKGKTKQKGIGYYTLCEKCNNNTGSWYGNEYARWTRTAFEIMRQWQQKDVNQGTVTLFEVYPLRFIKQVVTCFFSVIGYYGQAKFAQRNPGLVSFVLDKEEQTLPAGSSFFMNLYSLSAKQPTALRQYPVAAKINVVYDKFGNIRPVEGHVFQEIAHPPFQLAMTGDQSFFGATEITHFSSFGYDEKKDINLRLRIASSSSHLPGM